jgi:para-nitrobenzyl esterase
MPFGTQYGHAPLPAEHDLEAAWDAVAPEIEVLIGRTAEEAGLFLPRATPLHPWIALPVVGPALKKVLVGAVTAAVYGRAARRFARRHARAGGLAYHYVIEWSAPGNPFGSAHTIDLPLLFGDERTWSQANLVAGADWAEIHDRGRRMRRLWGDFARGTSLRSGGRIPGVVRFRKA